MITSVQLPPTESEQYAQFLVWLKTTSADPLGAAPSLTTSVIANDPKIGSSVSTSSVNNITSSSSGISGIKLPKKSRKVANAQTPPPSIMSQYHLSIPLNMQSSSLASVGSNQLLISRIPRSCPLPTILTDIANIGNLLGVTIDIDEFLLRWNSVSGAVFQTDENSGSPRISVVVYTLNIHEYDTAGNLRSNILPLFIHTQKGPSNVHTSHRLSVQALPFGTSLSCASFHEVVSFRGFPDSCHIVSAFLPVLLGKVLDASESSPILAVVQSRITLRVIQGRAIYVDESFLTFFAMESAVVSHTRLALQVTDHPSPFAIGPWCGQISKKLIGYRKSPTAVDELLASPLVLVLAEVSGDLETDLLMVSKYLDLSDPQGLPAAVGYLRGNIDSPVTKVGGSCLLLFPSTHGGGEVVRFNDSLWKLDHPHDVITDHHSYPGLDVLTRLYSINLEPPVSSSVRRIQGILLPPRAPAPVCPPPVSRQVVVAAPTSSSLMVTTTFADAQVGPFSGPVNVSSSSPSNSQVVSSSVPCIRWF